MRDQRTSASPDEDHWIDHRAILDLLIHHYPAPWTAAELARAISSEPAPGDPSSLDADDALRHLHGAGLIHRSGSFVFATRAAVEGARLRE